MSSINIRRPIASLARDFARELFRLESKVKIHRTHGRLTNEERTRIGFYANSGLPIRQISRKFACADSTVLIYARIFRLKA